MRVSTKCEGAGDLIIQKSLVKELWLSPSWCHVCPLMHESSEINEALAQEIQSRGAQKHKRGVFTPKQESCNCSILAKTLRMEISPKDHDHIPNVIRDKSHQNCGYFKDLRLHSRFSQSSWKFLLHKVSTSCKKYFCVQETFRCCTKRHGLVGKYHW